MSGLQLITTALAAGAGVGAKDVASAAVKDAYTGFKDLLTRRLARHGTAPQVLEGVETDPGVWQARLGADLTAAGATDDDAILAAARRLLDLLEPGTQAGGSTTVTVETNYGAAGTFNAPITITNHPPHPPTQP